MNEKLLLKAINDTSNVLAPVIRASYQLRPLPKLEVVEIANDVNKQLGYDLFDDLYYRRLVRDFSLVSRAVQHHALLSK